MSDTLSPKLAFPSSLRLLAYFASTLLTSLTFLIWKFLVYLAAFRMSEVAIFSKTLRSEFAFNLTLFVRETSLLLLLLLIMLRCVSDWLLDPLRIPWSVTIRLYIVSWSVVIAWLAWHILMLALIIPNLLRVLMRRNKSLSMRLPWQSYQMCLQNRCLHHLLLRV